MSNSKGTGQLAQDHDVSDTLIHALAWMLVVSGLLIAAAQIAQIGVPRAGAIASLVIGAALLGLNRAGQQRVAAYVFVVALLVLAALGASYAGPIGAHWVALPISTMVAGWLLAPRIALLVAFVGVCLILASYGLYLSGHVFLPHLVEVDVVSVAVACVMGSFVGIVSANVHQLQLRKNAALEAELQRKLLYLNTLMNSMPDLIWLKNPEGVYISCNARFERLYGASEVDIIGKRDEAFVQEALAEVFREDDRKSLKSDTPVVTEESLTFADGYQAIFETIKSKMVGSDGQVIGVLGVARDISERKRLEETLHGMAFYDTLTQLPNRRLLMDRLEQALRNSHRNNSHGVLFFLDLNRFKQLNDTHGHDAGDKLLIEVAKRLRAAVRENDTVARLGGDEFVILLEDMGAEPSIASQHAEGVAKKLKAILSEEYVLGDIRHHGSASIGTTMFLGYTDSAEHVIKCADSAMYAEKQLRDKSPGT